MIPCFYRIGDSKRKSGGVELDGLCLAIEPAASKRDIRYGQGIDESRTEVVWKGPRRGARGRIRGGDASEWIMARLGKRVKGEQDVGAIGA